MHSPSSVSSAPNLPSLGEGGGLDLSAERRLGERIAQQVYRSTDYMDDAVLGDYLQGLWQPLLAAARARGDLDASLESRFAWELMLVRDRSINAFALPGGYLGVHLGLVASVATGDELASVLAHELSHVSQRHISRLMARQSQQAPLIVGAMILGALAASASKNADVVQAAVVGGQAVAAQTQLNFSRDMEREADRVGFGVMTDAGFDGHGFVGMFDKLQQASRLSDDGSFPYLRSHPLTTERMADMKARLAPLAPLTEAQRAADAAKPPQVLHALMASRARVLAETDPTRWRAWLDEARAVGGPTPAGLGAADAAGRLYAGALSAWRLQNTSDAWSLAQRLQAWTTADPAGAKAARLLVLEMGLGPDGPPTGPQTLTQTWHAAALAALQAPDRGSLLLGAQVAVRQGRPAQASERLQVWVSRHPRDAQAWTLLSQAWAAQGQGLRALRAEAESRVAVLDLGGALDRLRSAQDLARHPGAGDHLEQSIIDTRFRQIQAQLRELEQEKEP